MTNSKTTAAADTVVFKAATKAESAYVADLAAKLTGVETAGKAIMIAVHGLVSKVGSNRACELALFAFEKAYPAGIPRQRLSQVRQFCAMPEKQRAELCNQYGTIGVAVIKKNAVSADGVFTPPVKANKAPRVGGAKDATGTPLSAAPATVLAAVATMLARIEADKLTKLQKAALAAVCADVAELSDMLK